jgi:Ca-activated chloride channel family protein
MVDRDRRQYLGLCAAGTVTALAGCANLALSPPATSDDEEPEKIDDWQYTPSDEKAQSGASGGARQQTTANAATTDQAGFAVGGAKDINTFRRNVREGLLPLPQALSYEGLFYDYYFETGGDGSCSSLFCPRYSPAVTPDPLSGETERYLTVGLDSGLSQTEFERKRLNLVIVLDISGSMSSPFDEYYYDRYGNRQTPEGDTGRKKIAVARDALEALTEQLREGDRLGIVLYNNTASLAKPLRPVERTDMDAIRGHIQEDIEAMGGTNLEAGIDTATELLTEYESADPTEYENRAIVLTDAMPNLGETTASGLHGTLADNAERGLHTTFVGVGLDFNPELIDRITALRGANYYSVHSADEFERRMGEEFEYMVTPLVYDLSLELDAEGYEIAQVYGSSAAEESTGEIMRVNTLFPSPTRDGQTRGGIVLVQVDKRAESGEMRLRASWETREGRQQSTATTITFPSGTDEQFANSGVRKAVALSRYADLLKNWMAYERDETAVEPEDGIGVPPENLGRWEQQSQQLTVSDQYEERIRTFREDFAGEVDAIGDDNLQKELDALDRILAAA